MSLLIAIVTAFFAQPGPCPPSVESAIRAVPGYAELQRPMRCNFVEMHGTAAAWAFRHGGQLHWYVGQAHISNPCGRPPCYRAEFAAFAGHRR